MTQTCGGCKHSKIPPPKMSKHKVPRVLNLYPGDCVYPAHPRPMVAFGRPDGPNMRASVWPDKDATKCPCFEAREVKP